jgi:hypothetical protein
MDSEEPPDPGTRRRSARLSKARESFPEDNPELKTVDDARPGEVGSGSQPTQAALPVVAPHEQLPIERSVVALNAQAAAPGTVAPSPTVPVSETSVQLLVDRPVDAPGIFATTLHALCIQSCPSLGPAVRVLDARHRTPQHEHHLSTLTLPQAHPSLT